ncbi:MAG TPA: phosphate signaling complex protein PhoU [Deltaproteobacteria bacterium]|nr:phosphate signaling complex protein PhoU [Deltaproteobacteria bacterium]
MTRDFYHKDLRSLEEGLYELGAMAEEAVQASIEALKARDFKASEEIIKNDLVINKKRFDMEEQCLLLIATQQPMAVDLRTIAAILHITSELERIADYAEGIARINLLIGDRPLVKPLIDIPRMAAKAVEMLEKSLAAFKARDASSARALCDEDDEVDALYDQVYRELLLLMIENPKSIEGATYLIWAAHNIERIADRVTNIAERVVFMVTGRLEEINVSKY